MEDGKTLLVIISTTRTVSKDLLKNIKLLGVSEHIYFLKETSSRSSLNNLSMTSSIAEIRHIITHIELLFSEVNFYYFHANRLNHI